MTTKTGISNIGQIAIAVTDIKKSIAFYQDILGLKFLFEVAPNLAFFDCGGTRLMLTTPQGDERDHKTSVIYYKVENIKDAADAIKKQGIRFESEPHLIAKMPDHELWIGFLRDPDQNLVGIMAEIPYK